MLEMIMFNMFLILVNFFKTDWWKTILASIVLNILMIMKKSNSMFMTNISMNLGTENISLLMILLSTLIVLLSFMASTKINLSKWMNLFIMNLMIMNMILMMTFSSLNLITFFFMFESTLIPTMFLILGWGNKMERVQSGFYILFYTFSGSIPLFVVILFHLFKKTTNSFYFILIEQNCVMYLCFLMGFLIKMPMFFVHSWLPKAHVEAPVSGSMILAGVLLKLGGYGMIKVLPSMKLMNSKWSFTLIVIALMGGILSSFICLRQSDMKSLIAYSSVAHMSLVICGILTMNHWGYTFSILMMVAHGLCSSALFFLVNVNYERSHTRSLYLNKGMMNILPSMSMWWFLLLSCNMASPPSLNLLSEIGLINSVISWSLMLLVPLGMISFIGASYSIYLFSFSQHGTIFSLSNYMFCCHLSEFLTVFLHWIPLNFMFLYTEMFL